MGDIKGTRLMLCGVTAGGVWVLFSAALAATVGSDFIHSVPSHQDGPPSAQAHAWLFTFTILTAIWAVWLFALIRPRFARRNTAVVVAGFAWWALAGLQSAKWIALLALPAARALLLGALTLPAMVAVTAIGAWLYERDGRQPE